MGNESPQRLVVNLDGVGEDFCIFGLLLLIKRPDALCQAAAGFVRRTLLRSRDTADELLLIVHWASHEHALAYRRGAVHEDLRRQALALLKEPLKTRDYELLSRDG